MSAVILISPGQRPDPLCPRRASPPVCVDIGWMPIRTFWRMGGCVA